MLKMAEYRESDQNLLKKEYLQKINACNKLQMTFMYM